MYRDKDFFDDRPANFDTESVHFTGLQPGQKYWAKRNGPGVVLTCKYVNNEEGYVVPVEVGYPYDLHECWRDLNHVPVAETS